MDLAWIIMMSQSRFISGDSWTTLVGVLIVWAAVHGEGQGYMGTFRAFHTILL